MTRPDHYATLGVPPTATLAEIKRAYRRAAAHAHPDKGGSEERMQALNAAKDVLYDAARRARYDAGEDDAPTGPPPIDAKARRAIRDLFAEAVRGNVLNPYQATLGGLRKGSEQAGTTILTYQQAIRRMEKQRGRVRAKGDSDMYADILESAITTAQGQIRGLEAVQEVASRAIAILQQEYEAGPQDEDEDFFRAAQRHRMATEVQMLSGSGFLDGRFFNPNL